MGSCLDVVNAARASFLKRHEDWTLGDSKLVRFLVQEGHTSPFRHCALSVEIKAPLFVTRQLQKYHIGSLHAGDMDGINEASYRYVSLGMEFYQPTEWRLAPANRKQGSAGPVPDDVSVAQHLKLVAHIDRSMQLYQSALDDSVAPEQARLFLPAYALYITWRWTMSLQSALHVVTERTAEDAQYETRQYGLALKQILQTAFPKSLEAWTYETV